MNRARVNEDCDNQALVRKYEVEIRKLKLELAQKESLQLDSEKLEEAKRQAIAQEQQRTRTLLMSQQKDFQMEKSQLEQKISEMSA